MPFEAHPLALLEERHVERCEDLPDEPAPGNYVVVDVLHFSNTVLELFHNGAEYVHVTDSRGDEFDFREEHPEARLGGGSTPAYEPTDGYDFFNSPSYVQSVDVEGRPVAMTSTNGGRAVTRLRESGGDDVEVYVGSTMNAAALGRHLRELEAPTYLVSAGSSGDLAAEDHIGAILVGRYLRGIPPTEPELTVFREHLWVAKGPEYVHKHELRRRDVLEYALAVDSSDVIPRLVGRRLVDVGPGSDDLTTSDARTGTDAEREANTGK
ncbi:MAG: 2-phosphosulfolactate phosphatase [Salinigranum sp.]